MAKRRPQQKPTSGFSFSSHFKGQEKEWEKRRVQTSGYGAVPEIEDGNYVCQLTACRSGADKNGHGYVSYNFVVQRGEFKSTKLDRFISLRVYPAREGEVQQTEWDMVDRVKQDLQRLRYHTADMSLAQIDAALTELNEEKPLLRCSVKNFKKRDGSKGINVYINDIIEDDDETDGPEEDEVSYEDEDEDEDEDGGDDAEDEDSDAEAGDLDDDEDADEEEEGVDEEDGEEPPEVGDEVTWKAPRARKAEACEVTTVNNSKQTVTLKRGRDEKEFKGVSWDDLVYNYE